MPAFHYPKNTDPVVLTLDGEPGPTYQVEPVAPKWSQEDSINFESARELIVLLMAYRSEWIAAEHGKAQPDLELVARWIAERSAYAAELRGLDVTDRDNIARIRRDYGAEARRLAALERA